MIKEKGSKIEEGKQRKVNNCRVRLYAEGVSQISPVALPPWRGSRAKRAHPGLGYAELGVPEIWRFDGQQLNFWQRRIADPPGRDDNSYRQAESSLAFPSLRSEQLLPYLRIIDKEGETTRLRRFAEWLRENYCEKGCR